MNTKLVVIDDEKMIRETIRDYFEDIGWDVKVFSSGEEALEFFKYTTPEYVIVDGHLPGMSGTDFILKACRIKTGIKYIIYTGSFDLRISDDLRTAGITEKNIVLKPATSFSILQDALEQLNGSAGN